MIAVYITLAILVIIIVLIMFSGIKIVSQTSVLVVERLGSYKKTLKNGVNWIIPFIDRIKLKETLKEKVIDYPAQDVITKDNVTMKVDTIVYMQITDPKLYAYGVENPLSAVEFMTATALRNLIGDLELDQTLTSRDTINAKLRDILDDATDPWGIKILRVELKNILPPPDIRMAMEKQMRAEREKRELVLVAEGQKQSKILVAQGSKEAAILEAEGIRQKSILEAEGKKKALELINAAKPTPETLTLRSYESVVKASNGKSSTILLPTDITDVSKIAATFGAVVGKTKK